MTSLRWLVPLALAAALGGCGAPATPEQRASLVGVWAPTDTSGRTVTFHDDGVFDYQYTYAKLRLHWELGNQGEIKLSTVDGGVRWSCWYSLKDGVLHIDKGNGETCVTPNSGPPEEPMPLEFGRE
jgi:hypothetical protein